MKKIHVHLTFAEPILGTAPNNEDIYVDYVASKGPDIAKMEEEIAALGVDEVVEKGMTVFPRGKDGQPIIWDYQVKGFFKDACSMLAGIGGKGSDGKKRAVNESGKISAYKKTIDGQIFVYPRQIPIVFEGGMGVCQRPLRAMTMRGERVALAMSEEIPAGATMDFDVKCLNDAHMAAVLEWLDYGEDRGIGQWRNSGKGRFTYTAEEI